MATVHDLLTTKVAPQALEAEHAVLGAILVDGAEALSTAGLRAADFFKEGHRKIFEAMLALAHAGRAVDILTVTAMLRAGDALDEIGGAAFLAQLEAEAGILPNLPTYGALIRDAAAKRECIRIGTDLIAASYDGGRPDRIVRAAAEGLAAAQALCAPRPARPLPALVSLPTLFETPPAEPCWLIDQLVLQAANGWIGAGAKVGKSYLALDLLLAAALGTPWLDHFAVPRPLVVVLVEEEDSAWRVYNRVARLCRGRGVEPPATFHVAIRTGLQLDDPSTLDPFLRAITPLRPDLIAWDVFNRLHTKSEKHPDQMLPILRRVDQVRNELGCANLIAHHSRKPGATGPDLASGGQKLRGPSEFWGWAENSIYLSALKGKGVVRIEPESKDALLEPFGAHLEDCPDGSRRWVYDGAIRGKVDKGAQTREALVALLQGGTWLTAAQIADQLKLTERAIKGHTCRASSARASSTPRRNPGAPAGSSGRSCPMPPRRRAWGARREGRHGRPATA